ncbi:MAG: FtsX-like permease family protein [Litorimonas sp.]
MNRAALKIAIRELSGGLKGFWIYLACIILGTAAIASAGSVTEVFSRGLANEARVLLGGDAMFSVSQRQFTQEERDFIAKLGQTTESAGLDVMASVDEHRRQVNLRAVDEKYPLVGAVSLSGGQGDFQTAIAQIGNAWGAVVSQSFLDAFEVKVGDNIQLGQINAIITARLDGTPDRIGTPGSFSPEVMISFKALKTADVMGPGQIFATGFRVKFHEAIEGFNAVKIDAKETFKDAGLRIREPSDAVDGLQNLLTTLNSFLAIIGIASLVAGGVGVAQATTSFLDTRIASIAALKALGADSHTIRTAYMLQLGILAFIGALIGIFIGAAAPYLLISLSANGIALPQTLGIYPVPLLKALILGLLAAIIFALPAIGRARATRPAALFRQLTEQSRVKTPVIEKIGAFSAAILLAALAIFSSANAGVTAALLLGAIIAWAIFLLAAYCVRKLAQILSKNAKGFWRLCLSNLGGPGSLAPTIVPSLGLGLALLTLVASVQANLLRQISETAPESAPSLVFSQIPNANIDEFDAIIAANSIEITDPDLFRRAPFLQGRVMSLNDIPIDKDKVAPSERWVVQGETSLTYLAKKPPEAELVEGEWWAQDYAGDLQVSVEVDVAKGLKVGLGDTIEFRIFGRNVKAEITSLRRVDWGTFGISSNTAFILSPGTLEAARPYHVAIAKTPPKTEEAIITSIGQVLPDVIVFQTRQALATAARLFGNIATAVNAAAAIVTIAGLLVLLGAFAAMARKRQTESALLKVFGAERRTILALYGAEFAFAGAAGALIGAGLGIAGAYPIVTQVFEAQWRFPWKESLGIAGLAITVSAFGGMSVGIATLRQKPARIFSAA